MKMRLTAAVCAASVVAVLAGSVSQADVLIAAAPGDDLWFDDIRTKIEATGILSGHTIDTFPTDTGTPTATQLAAYDAVLVFPDKAYQDATLWGDRLADYVDSGGGVVVTSFAWSNSPAGRFFNDGYSPLTLGPDVSGTNQQIGTVHCPNHPVMRKVNSFDGGTASFREMNAFATGAIAIANWTDDLPFAAEMPGFNARIVALNFFPPSSDCRSDFWDATTDGALLMANSLAHVMTSPGPIPSTVGNFKVNKGQQAGGDVGSLSESDNNSLGIGTLRTGAKHRTKMLVNLRVACADVMQLNLRVETGVDAGNVKTRIHMYDFDARRWRLIDAFAQSRLDRSKVYRNIANPGRFIKSNGLVKVRISSVRKGNDYTLRHDHVEVRVRPVTQ